jgi:hypothetical protein
MPDRRRTASTDASARAPIYQALMLDLAARLEAEAMTRAQRLDALDLPGASACHQVARRARSLARRFDAWNVADRSTYDARKADLDEYFEIIRLARAQGIELTAG